MTVVPYLMILWDMPIQYVCYFAWIQSVFSVLLQAHGVDDFKIEHFPFSPVADLIGSQLRKKQVELIRKLDRQHIYMIHDIRYQCLILSCI